MTLSMYQASVPAFELAFTNLKTILAKGAALAAAKKIEDAVLVNARLAADMLPLSRQVQIATDIARRGLARLVGQEAPSIADTETTLAELTARVDATIAFLKTFSAAQIDGSEGKAIELTVGGNAMKFTGQDYLLKFVIPNVYFHITTAYAILRHNGAELGKKDFLGAIQ